MPDNPIGTPTPTRTINLANPDSLIDSADWDSAAYITPGRSSRITLDIDDPRLIRARVSQIRTGGEVAAPSADGKADDSQHKNMIFLRPLQAWALKPIQTDISSLNDLSLAAQDLILDLAKWAANLADLTADPPKAGMAEENTKRLADDLKGALANALTGGTGELGSGDSGGAGLTQAVAGDKFINKVVPPPPATYADPGMASDYKAPDTASIPLDRVLISDDVFPPNQAFFLRWSVPGTIKTSPEHTWRFYFGQYCLSLDGDGYARLYEVPANWTPPTQNSDGTTTPGPDWPLRHKFRYCQPSQVCSISHSMAIWPIYDSGGHRYIVFANSALDAINATAGVLRHNYAAQSAAESIYNCDSPARGGAPDQSPGHITASALAHVDVRRDVNLHFQISILGYEQEGWLTDAPFSIEVGGDPTADPNEPVLQVGMRQGRIGGTADGRGVDQQSIINAAIYDADTGTLFVNGQDTKPYVQFHFQGNGLQTPLLFGYELFRREYLQVNAPGAFSADVRSVSLNSYDGRPESQTGTVAIYDPISALPRLKVRGSFPAQLTTSFLPPGETQRINVVLHRGYCVRPSWIRVGKAGRTFPVADARTYTLPLLGMWDRLTWRQNDNPLKQYQIDESAPAVNVVAGSDVLPPWKVTDCIKDILSLNGFLPEQIAITDLPLRLWPGEGDSPDEWHIEQGKGWGEVLSRICRNYLGSFLYYEPNIGTYGAWILVPATRPGATAIAHFSSDPAFVTPTGSGNSGAGGGVTSPVGTGGGGGGAVKLPHSTAAYAANTYPILGPISGTNVPPEFNLVVVTCPIALSGSQPDAQITNAIPNLKSAKFPGFPDTSDPNHPDFLGYIKPVTIPDASLAGMPTGDVDKSQLTQMAVDWTAHRVFDFAAHAQLIERFPAPYAIVKDTTQGPAFYRPLRFQDPITVEGTAYLIRSVNPSYDNERQQLATYEVIRVVGVT